MREGRLKNLIKTGILGKDVCVTCETHYGLTFCNEGSSKGMTTPMNPLIILNKNYLFFVKNLKTLFQQNLKMTLKI